MRVAGRIKTLRAWGIATAAAMAATGAAWPVLHAQSIARFSAAQADAGKRAYDVSCASCHGPHLDDGAFAPPLKGPGFLQKYGGKSADTVFTVMSTKMPPDRPGSLDASAYADILAYVIEANGIKPGTEELPSDIKQLSSIIVPRPALRDVPAGFIAYGFSPYVPKPPDVAAPDPLARITPVTDTLLTDPPASDWLMWRRTYDDQGFSPLRQVDKTNIADLRVAWAWTLPGGNNEMTPLVHDGVLFIEAGDKVEALNAKTGDLLWEYSRQLPNDVRTERKKSMSIYGDKIYVGTSDIHAVALDIKTGKMIWDQQVGDYTQHEEITGGPLVAKGKLMIGITGTGVGAKPGGPRIVALDPGTGKIAWQFHTIARPGEPGGNSWNGMPLDKRTGASVWTPGSYDPKLGLAFFGTAQTYDTGPLLHPVNQAGVTNNALYTDSTLALDPDTGKLAWYFQHLPDDQWDLDWAFERQLVQLPVNGILRTAVVTSGKQAIYDAMDAATGKYLFSMDLGLQNVVSAIDPKTGAKTINPAVVPGKSDVFLVCPDAGGAKSWMPASYDAAAKTLFVPLVESCMDLFPVQGEGRAALSSGYNVGLRERPGSDGKYGRVEAIDLATRKVVWMARQRAPMTSGVLATAGGLVFAAAADRYFRAYDATDGKLLWEFRLNDTASSCPITYTVDGKQYVAIMVAPGAFQATSYAPLVPEVVTPPDRGSELWVFALPEKASTGAKAPNPP